MKKVLSFTAIAALAAMVSCGPSQAELDAAKAKRDSAIADSTRIADERAKAIQDSTDAANAAAAAEAAKRVADSLHQDSIDKKLIKVKK